MKCFSRSLPLIVLCLSGGLFLSSCSTAKKEPAAAAGNEKWRGSYEDAVAKYNGKPGWNQAPNIPPATNAAGLAYNRVNVNGGPYIALTFDDGPHPSNTPRLLDMLKQRNVKATFFVVGSNVQAYPAIMKRMVAEGHEVANHTWGHPDMTKLSQAALKKEMDTTRDAIIATTGVAPRLCRPPYGATNSAIKAWLKSEYGYPSILWSVDPLDWKKPGASVVADRLVAGASNGGILLVHDIHKPTIDAMPSTLDRLLGKGYKFLTVSQLISLEQPAQSVAATGVAPAATAQP